MFLTVLLIPCGTFLAALFCLFFPTHLTLPCPQPLSPYLSVCPPYSTFLFPSHPASFPAYLTLTLSLLTSPYFLSCLPHSASFPVFFTLSPFLPISPDPLPAHLTLPLSLPSSPYPCHGYLTLSLSTHYLSESESTTLFPNYFPPHA